MRVSYFLAGIVVSTLSLSDLVLGADVSLVSGLFKKESEKKDGINAGSTSTFGAGGRYHDDLGDSYSWYGLGELFIHNYSAPDGRKAPGDAMSMKFGGGMRYYFQPFSTAVVPFGSAGGDVRNVKEVSWTSTGFAETTTNGLYYNGAIGVRAGLDSNIFVEIELPLFDRALFSVAKTVEATTVNGVTSESKSETTSNELWVSSYEGLPATKIAVGYRF